MSNYIYPAVFHAERNGEYTITFPDIAGCTTSAETMAEGISAAEDCLSLMLYELRKEGKDFPTPSDIDVIADDHPSDPVITIDGDPDFYERYFAEYHPEVT